MSAAIAALRAELDELVEENRQLKQLLAPPLRAPAAWRLTGQEETLFAHLCARELVTTDSAMMALYGGEAEVEPKIVDVFVCKLRAKTRGFGVSIKTIWGRGYELACRARWRQALEEGTLVNGQLTPISFDVPVKVYDALRKRAAPMNMRPTEYAKRLFEAAFSARVAGERGEESGDAALDRQVRQVFLLADCEPDFVAEKLGIPAGRVARIIEGWKSFFASPAEHAVIEPLSPPAAASVDFAGPARLTIARMWKEEASPAAIGAAVNSDADTIRAFAAANPALCPPGRTTPAPEQNAGGYPVEMIRTMWADGMSGKDIGAAIGKTEGAFLMWAGKHRDVCPKRGPRGKAL